MFGTFVCPAGNTASPKILHQLLPRGTVFEAPMFSGVGGTVINTIRAEGEGRDGGGSGA